MIGTYAFTTNPYYKDKYTDNNYNTNPFKIVVDGRNLNCLADNYLTFLRHH